MQIKINGQTISLAAPEPFSFYIKKREDLFSVILRRKGHLRKMQNPDNGGKFTYNDGRQAVFERG